MNVVFLLLTTAAGVGSHPSPQPAASCQSCGPTIEVNSSCGGCCEKPSVFDKMRGLFAKKSCGEQACATPAPCCTPAPAPQTCCNAAPKPCCTPAPAVVHHAPACCEAAPCGCGKPSWFDRFKGMFAKKSSDCGCAVPACTQTPACCGSAQPAVTHPAPAALPAPAVLPGVPHAAPAINTPYHPAPVMNPPHAGNPAVIPHGDPIVPPPAINPAPVPAVNPRPLPTGNPPAEPIQKLPMEEKNGKNTSAPLPAPVVTPAAATVETGVKNPFDLDRRYEMRVSHAADYSLLTGQLFYVHADGGLWVLRYASLSAEDAKGGSVILTRDRVMNQYREGDLVTVEGEVIGDRGSSRLGGQLYRVQNIRLVDRQR